MRANARADKSRPNLGGWENIKSDLFAAIVYPALQARAQRIDLEVFKQGIGNVVEKGELPCPINFSKGVPACFAGLGTSVFFGYYGRGIEARVPRGDRWRPCVVAGAPQWSTWRRGVSNLMSSKNSGRWNLAAPSNSHRASG